MGDRSSIRLGGWGGGSGVGEWDGGEGGWDGGVGEWDSRVGVEVRVRVDVGLVVVLGTTPIFEWSLCILGQSRVLFS